MSSTMSFTRKQDDYNKVINDCDLFICLIHTKAGKYTQEEFDIAWTLFNKTGTPKILIYFKNDAVPPDSMQNSRKEFKQKIESLQHFPDSYTGYKDLEGKFKRR